MYVESKKNGTNELIYKTETVKDIESKRMVMRGRGGRDNLRGWDRHIPLCAACSVTQSCPTLCDPMDCSPPSSFVHRDSLHKSIGIFTTQGLNPGLPHHRRILYHLSHQGSPYSPQILTQHTLEKKDIFFPCHHKMAGGRLKDRKISQQT